MIKCAKCQQIDFVQKSGIVRGKQRYFCKACDYHFTLPEAVENRKNKPRHQVTIVDIANELGISKSTVSRALRGHTDIHEGTRKMILDLAQQLEYHPNPLANALLKSRTNIVGILVPEFRHYFFPTVIMGAQEILSKAGYNVMICHSDESYDTEVANVKALMNSRVDGLLVSVTTQTNNVDHFRAVLRKEVPLVFFNRVCPELDTPQVIVDDYAGAFQAVEHLVQQGYRRIAHLAGPVSLLVSRLRMQGYLDALQKHGLPVDNELIIHYDLTEEKARIYANYLLSLPQPPDAIFAINDPTAIEIMLVAKSRGVKIPQELGIVGFSNDPISAIIEPPLTTVEQPVWEMGRQAARILLEQMENPHIETYQLPTKLVVRGSSVNY
ncbi:LacI family DNA-binding transcriptional regulator [Runella sp. SP2]|uniref:LacI family DNA-binding transcriptional regulator n=1 Tax=Runella sp. SP2 TaxID=2268026 RepID=UPI000F08C105|nr:substrate-binding domain-containing protein [Runella sp. SP2]AYQ34466.1 LacI family DNA-binding transcriptional regulator [Runella sp. SP2]